MGDASDVVLWDHSLAGDSAAFGVLFDRHRDRVYRHARFLATLPAPEQVPDFGDDLAERLDAEPRRIALSKAIRRLSPVDQSLIALTEFEGLGLREASAALGISYGAAKTRMSRARRRLGASVSLGASANLEGTTP